MTREPGRLRRLGGATAALAGLAAILGGPPYALARLTGRPLPRHLPAWPQVQAFLTSPLSDDAIIKGLACAVWLLWALAAVSILIETAAALTGHHAPRLPVISPFQAVAAALIGATIVISLPHATPRPAQPLHAALTACTTAAPLIPGQPEPDPAPAPAAASTHSTDSRDPVTAQPPIYRVAPGDDLWAIADRYLGNGERWHELYAINAGRPQPDGRTLTNPSLIYPGWILQLGLPAATPSTPPPGQSAPHATVPAPAPSPSRTAPAPSPSRTAPAPSPSRTARAPAPATRQREIRDGAHSAAAATRHAHPRPAGVRLPSGALTGIAVAVLVAAALTLARIQRRRRYRPHPRLTGSLQPDEPPLPAVIAALRRAARPALPGADDDTAPDPGTEPVPDPYLDPYDDVPGPGPASALPGHPPASEPELSGQASGCPDAGDAAGSPAREPGTIPVGVRGTREAVIDIAALGGLGLTGPGAPAAARGILTALLAQHPPAGARNPAAVIIPAADLARLLPADHLDPIPGVSAPASLTAALDEMEATLLRHARTTGALDPDDPATPVTAVGAGGPGAALIATADPGATQQLRGILASGRALGAAAILLGPWQTGVTCHVAADGMITEVTPPDPGLDGTRLFHLAVDDTAAIATILRDADAIASPHPQVTRAGPVLSKTPGDRPTARPVPTRYLPAPAVPVPPPQTPAADPPEQPASRAADAPAPARPAAAANSAPSAAGTTPPVRLTILGPLRITAAGKEISGGLRKARELLAFLAVHQDGATAEAISEALWPESEPARADSQRNLALRKARDMLRTATSLSAPMWILHTASRYRLDPSLISTDLQEFARALDQARQATTDDTRLAACQQAAGLYQGELAEGAAYEWAEPYAEAARRRALDAWTAIADILQPRDPGQALAALESALTHDTYNEFLYQKIMRFQADAGHPEAVRRTLSLLEARLTELGITPGTQTRQVAASLLGTAPAPHHHHHHHHHRPSDTIAPAPQQHERRAVR